LVEEEEERHEYVEVAKDTNRHLRFLSGGEQKKALLTYLLLKNPGFIISDCILLHFSKP
jgi:molybdate transport system ATP-binding protein